VRGRRKKVSGKIMRAEEAVRLIEDGDTLSACGIIAEIGN